MHMYRNILNRLFYNCTFSHQMICGPNLECVDCIAKWAESVHDARTLRESRLFAGFESNNKPLQGIFLGTVTLITKLITHGQAQVSDYANF